MGASADFLSVAGPCLASAIGMYIFFCRYRSRHPEIFQPRAKRVLSQLEQRAEHVPEGCCSWFLPLCCLSVTDLARNAGTEAAARVIFQATLMKICMAILVLGATIAVPIFATAGGEEEELEVLTLSNVLEDDEWRHWAIAALCWPATMVVYYLVWDALKDLCHMKNQEEKALCKYWRHTVLVTDIPRGSRSTKTIESFFEEKYPGQVLSVQPIRDLGREHEKDFQQYTEHWRAWRKAIVIEERSESQWKPRLVRTGFLGLVGKKVETVSYHKDQCSELRKKMEARLAEWGEAEQTFTSAFVTFGSVRTAMSSLVTFPYGFQWGCKPATHPREYYWPNLCKGRSLGQLLAQEVLAGVAVANVVIFFIPFLAFSQGVANLEELAQQYKWLDWIYDVPSGLRGFLQGLLPVMVVFVLTTLVVPALELLTVFSGSETQRSFQHRIMWYTFFYFFFDSFIVVATSSSLFNKMREIAREPESMTTFLGESLPVVSTFFMSFLLLRALGDAPWQIALLPQVVYSWVQRDYTVTTEEEKQEGVEPTYSEYAIGLGYASDLFVLGVCLSYMVVAPLAVVCGLVYFALSFVSTKYLLNYRWKSSFNSDGLLVVSAFRGVLLALALGQVVAVCCLSLRESLSAILVAPLAVASFAWAVSLPHWGMGKHLQRQDVPVELIQEVDKRHQEADVQRMLQLAAEAKLFTQPSVRPNFDHPVEDRFDWEEVESKRKWWSPPPPLLCGGARESPVAAAEARWGRCWPLCPFMDSCMPRGC